MTIDPDAFKSGMRRLAASVCIITTSDGQGGRNGMTATAVCSVAADPPTLLCCINRSNVSHGAIRRNGVFAVNVLTVQDRELANRFAGGLPPEERFKAGLWTALETGAPMLETASTSFDCRLANDVEVGSHAILFGEIQGLRVRDASTKPLLYAHGAYGGFANLDAQTSADLMWIPSWVNETA